MIAQIIKSMHPSFFVSLQILLFYTSIKFSRSLELQFLNLPKNKTFSQFTGDASNLKIYCHSAVWWPFRRCLLKYLGARGKTIGVFPRILQFEVKSPFVNSKRIVEEGGEWRDSLIYVQMIFSEQRKIRTSLAPFISFGYDLGILHDF